jgi:transposase InsO family protein
MVCSMSANSNCYDNTCAESFFHTLKVNVIHGEYFATRDEVRRTVLEYIEVDYNRNRRHSTNGYVSPAVLEAQLVA